MLTQERLKELLHYDPLTGIFTNRITRGRAKKGKVAGCEDNNGYLITGIDNALYRNHRMVWLYMYGCWPTLEIDHIDGDRLNNKIINIRDVSSRENGRNKRKLSNNTSGCHGVYWHNQASKWAAQIKCGGDRESLGLFTNKNDAIKARKLAEEKYGFHKNHGVNINGE